MASVPTIYGPDSFAAFQTASVSIPNSHLRQGEGRLPSPPGGLTASPIASTTNGHLNPVNHNNGLPTPSSSISPGLPPLYDVGMHASGDRLGIAQTADSAITPSLLATHYLPGILLMYGPLAIRHLTAYLTASIPGFSDIPPAKQRRLIVGALEGRGGSSGTGETSGALAAGGVNRDVIFEKVGWGRWDARKNGDPPCEIVSRGPNQGVPGISLLPPGTEPVAMSPDVQPRAGDSGVFLQVDDDRSRRSLPSPGEEADKMSLDEDNASLPGSETSEDEDTDMTEEEDWATMGAAMLRSQVSPVVSDAVSNTGGQPTTGSPNVLAHASSGASGGSFTTHRTDAESYVYLSTVQGGCGYWDNGVKRNREEQDAIEALVKLSSI